MRSVCDNRRCHWPKVGGSPLLLLIFNLANTVSWRHSLFFYCGSFAGDACRDVAGHVHHHLVTLIYFVGFPTKSAQAKDPTLEYQRCWHYCGPC